MGCGGVKFICSTLPCPALPPCMRSIFRKWDYALVFRNSVLAVQSATHSTHGQAQGEREERDEHTCMVVGSHEGGTRVMESGMKTNIPTSEAAETSFKHKKSIFIGACVYIVHTNAYCREGKGKKKKSPDYIRNGS